MRNPGLDLLRLLAVLLVMGRHLASPAGSGQLTEGVFSPLIRGGWIGVDIFFVLSGILISALLFREYKATGSINVPRFLIRRALKIYPAYWCLLLPTIVFSFLVSRNAGVELPARKIIGELLFMQNYVGRLWGHTWSLAIEEHFYIGFAVLLSVAGYFSRGLQWIPRLCTFTFVLCLGLRILVWQSTNEFRFDAQVTPTHLRIDSLMAGVLLSPLKAIEAYFRARIDSVFDPSANKGCLVTNSITERALFDERTRALTAQSLDYMRTAFTSAVANARKLGEISRDKDPVIWGALLLNCAQGLFVLSRVSPDRQTVTSPVNEVLKLLKS